jgi:hypothetical protein
MAQNAARPTLATDNAAERSETSISNADIAAIAFQPRKDRDCPEGSPEEDWYEAERQLEAHAYVRIE